MRPLADSTTHDTGSSPPLTAGRARLFLRKLRDVDWKGTHAGQQGLRLRGEGCVSLDAPVEDGVRYALSVVDGPRYVLELRLAAGALAVVLEEPSGARVRARVFPLRDGSLRGGERGPADVTTLGCVVPESTDPLAFEGFLADVATALVGGS
jgi:hypothetical protein